MVIETLEKEDNESIKNRIKLPVEEWQNSNKKINRETKHAKNNSTTRRNN